MMTAFLACLVVNNVKCEWKIDQKLDRTISTRARRTEFVEAVRKPVDQGRKQHIKGRDGVN